MSNETTRLPNPDAVKQLRNLNKKRKEERLKYYNELAKVWKKKNPEKKIAKTSDHTDVEA